MHITTLDNLAAGWALIVLGMLSGAALGVGFQNEKFMGGYASRPRRLVRLGHISFFGLGILNIMFALSLGQAGLSAGRAALASWGFVVGGVTMPLCCALTAWKRGLHVLFPIPVLSLCAGAGLMAHAQMVTP